MKIAVFSDTHGNLEYLHNAFLHLKDNYSLKTLIHLGDNCQDLSCLESVQGDITIYNVHGVFCEHYKKTEGTNRPVISISGIPILLTHTPTKHENDRECDLDPEEICRIQKVKVILYGHTHIAKIEIKDERLWINPGHLKKEDKKGYPASFALLDLSPYKIKSKIISYQTWKEIMSTDYYL